MYNILQAMLLSLLFTVLYNTSFYNQSNVNVSALIDLPQISIQGSNVVMSLMTSYLQAMQLKNSDIIATISETSDTQAKQSIQTNSIDLGIVVGSPSLSDLQAYPDTVFRPVMATGIAPVCCNIILNNTVYLYT